EEMGFNYPILVGQTEGVNAAASFGVEFYALPFTIFTAADGQTLGVRTGELHAEHLDELVAVLEALRDGRTDIDGARARLTELLYSQRVCADWTWLSIPAFAGPCAARDGGTRTPQGRARGVPRKGRYRQPRPIRPEFASN